MPSDAPKTAAEPRIAGYRIEGVLGRGATGTVYRARQTSVDRAVALKVLHPDLVGTRAELRLQREARTTARLAHPNIISAIDMGESEGRWWYAMELVDGVSLSERLREKPLNEREALRLFTPLADALQHAFEQGVVHRDIKPANILIERGGRALLVDLGLAAAEDDPALTRGGGTLGTPHYISPEQARDPKDADTQSDLWSLGATLYHAVTGRPPFQGDSVAEILSNVLYARIDDPREMAEDLSSGFVLVLRKCLTRDRAFRYATPAELSADLERLRERRAPRIQVRGLDPLARSGAERSRGLALAGLALVVLGGVTWWALDAARQDGGGGVSGLPPAEDPLDGVARAVEAETRGLSAAFAVLARERARELDAGRAARVRDLESRLSQRFDAEFDLFRRQESRNFEAWLAARDFQAAADFAGRGAAAALAERCGASTLPEALARDVEGWCAQLAQRLEARRDQLDAAYETALARVWNETVRPRVDRLQAAGDWLAARDLLLSGAGLLTGDPSLDAHGVRPALLERGREDAQQRLDARRAELDQAWSVLDGQLALWVEERAEALRSALEDGSVREAAASLRSDWERELTARGLDAARFPHGLAQAGHERLAREQQKLALRERELGEEIARAWFDDLEAASQALWRARRFGQLAESYALRAEEAWVEPVRARLKLAVREARLLDGLLTRAAQGVKKRNGETLELRLGTLAVVGRLDAGVDPQTRPFRLVPSNGREWRLALREVDSDGQSAPQLVGVEALESLARAARSEPLEPEHVLALCLLRLRENDVAGARAGFNSGSLPVGDPLVTELARRLNESATAPPRGERRDQALRRLRVLQREIESPVRDPGLVGRIDEALTLYAEALETAEVAELRAARDRLAQPPRPGTLEAFVQAYRLPAAAVELGPGPNRATLRFGFRGSESGSFEHGEWVADGAGWTPGRSARSDTELCTRASPTLALVEPLRTSGGVLDVLVRIEQPTGLAPRLLIVSIGACHFVLVGASEGQPARALVDTGDVLAVVERARREGKPFTGWKDGRTVELHLVLHRGSKWAQLEVDGHRVAEPKLPHLGPEVDPPLVVRAWEALRLLSIELEGGRR